MLRALETKHKPPSEGSQQWCRQPNPRSDWIPNHFDHAWLTVSSRSLWDIRGAGQQLKSEKWMVKGEQGGWDPTMSCSWGWTVLPRMGPHYILQLSMDSASQDRWLKDIKWTPKLDKVPQQNLDTVYSYPLGPISRYPGWLQVLLLVSLWKEVCEHESAVLQNSCCMLCPLHASAVMRKDAKPEAFCIVNEDITRWDGASRAGT